MIVLKCMLLCLLPVGCFSQITLARKTLLNNKVEIMAPEKLKQMTDEMFTLKYHRSNKPLMVLTDENAEVNLIADYTPQQLTDDRLYEYKTFQLEGLKKTHPELTVLDSAVSTINGKKVGFFKFISQAIDQKVFNYYFFTIIEGRVLLFSFNCIESLRPKWEKIADEIVASVKMN